LKISSETPQTPPTVAQKPKDGTLYENHGEVICRGIEFAQGDMDKFQEFWKMYAIGRKVCMGKARISDFTGVPTEGETGDLDSIPF
jgi:hypothetical protein